MKTAWTISLYCGITLKWDDGARTLDISMPGYIEKLLLKFKHGDSCNVQNSPYKAPTKIYGKGAQYPIPDGTTKKIDKSRINGIQQVVRGVLYYTRDVDNTVLVTLSSIASEQTIPTLQ